MTYYAQPVRYKDFGCYQCEWTGSLTARDERGLTVTYPCDCQRHAAAPPRQSEEGK
jgi:hypothetical protein